MLGVSVPLLMLIAALVGFSTTLGRNAFDALVQRVAPDALLGRAGARYETEFQLAWVFGGVSGHADLPAGGGEHDRAHAHLRAGAAAVPPRQP